MLRNRDFFATRTNSKSIGQVQRRLISAGKAAQQTQYFQVQPY